MKLVKYSLFQRLSEDILLKYSLCKLGDPETIYEFALGISNLIKEQLIKNEEYILYTTDVTNRGSHKNSFLLAREIARALSLELIVGGYNFTYDKSNFYDNQKASERKNHIPKIKKANLGPERRTVIIIDDSFFTGKTLRVITEELKKYTDTFLFFSIINLSKQITFTEEAANSYFIEKRGVEGLVKILNKKEYIPTTYMLRVVENLSPEEKYFVLSKFNLSKKEQFKKSYLNYIGKDL